ncbi:DNA damage-binding protein 1b [Meredithblackwellia eburnea MCA 4105]
MLYVATASPASAQLQAITCDFISPNKKVVIVNKLTRLEVLESQESSTLKTVIEIPVWSTIASIASIKLKGHPTSSILVLTTCLRLFSLSYSNIAPHIVTSSSVSIFEHHTRIAEYQTIAIDPLHRCIAVHAYNGLLRIIPLGPLPPSKGRRGSRAAATSTTDDQQAIDLSRGYSVRLKNLNVTDLAFLPTSSDYLPTIGCLSADHSGRRVLNTYHVNLIEKELTPVSGPAAIEDLVLQDPGSETLIPVASDEGTEGILVVGEESVRWVPLQLSSGSDTSASKGKGRAGAPAQITCDLPVGMVQAWTAVQDVPGSFLLGDIYGRLQLLKIGRAHTGKVASLSIQDLGDTCSPTSIVFVTPSLIYISSRFADSQLIRLPTSISGDSMSVEGNENDLQLVEGYASLAPIMDCCLVTTEGGGASHVVTCSGAYKGGSLRIVRQGVGLTELANLEIEGIRQLWNLSWKGEQLLVVGFVSETKVLSFSSPTSNDDEAEESEVEELELPAFNTDIPTLLAGTVGPLVFQVTVRGVSYSDASGSEVSFWAPEGGKKVTLAASAGTQLVLAVEGGAVLLLEVEEGCFVQKGAATFPNEVACLDVSAIGGQQVATVGLWTSQSVSIVHLPSFKTLVDQPVETTYLLRSVLLTTFADGVTHLFAGTGDGSVASYVVDTSSWLVLEATAKIISLGTTPISLKAFIARGAVNVFVSSDRPTIISRPGDRLVYSSNVSGCTPFDSSTYPTALALASPDGLRIGRIEEIQRVDIRTVPFEDDGPQRIAYDSSTSTYGVVCLARDIDRRTGEQTTRGSIKVIDSNTFEELSHLPLLEEEEGQSICVAKIGEDTCYVIGTAFVRQTETQPTSGRLLVVVAFTLDEELNIKPVASWAGAFIALNISLAGNDSILVADAMRSLTLLELKTSPYALNEVARDYRAFYMTANAALDANDEFIGSESDLNLFTVQKENVTTARSMADEHALSPRGAFHLGEMVSKFTPGSFVPQFGEVRNGTSAHLVYATSAGSLGVIAGVDEDSSKVLSELERNLREVVVTAGELSHEDWRSFKSERTMRPPAGFIDGNLVQAFASMSKEEVEKVLAGSSEHQRISVPEAHLAKIVEEFGRLH